ncbi:MAG: hypothetical protein GY847_34770 [Proteobacteria bacterium]|nr:hypothetical protein [Pseudomonadota bacterium]
MFLNHRRIQTNVVSSLLLLAVMALATAGCREGCEVGQEEDAVTACENYVSAMLVWYDKCEDTTHPPSEAQIEEINGFACEDNEDACVPTDILNDCYEIIHANECASEADDTFYTIPDECVPLGFEG